MAGLSSLSDELHVRIFKHLDALSLVAVSATCRLWKGLVKRLYIALCHRYGVVDGPPHKNWPVVRRLEALKEHHRLWSNPDWSNSFSFHLNIEAKNWELFGGVYAEDTKRLGILKLQNTICATPRKQETRWTVDTRLNIKDFGMDPSQDLLVIVIHPSHTLGYREVHLRSLSTGQEHPDALEPILTLEVEAWQRAQNEDHNIRATNDLIGILFKNKKVYKGHNINSNILAIWNWKTGQIVFERSSTSEYFISGFCFISHNQILLGTQSLTQDSRNNSLTLLDMTSLTILDKEFILPPTHQTAQLSSLEIEYQTAPEAYSLQYRPFYAQKMCLVTLQYIYDIKETTIIQLVFFISSLVGIVPSSTGTIEKYIVPWDQWSKHVGVMNWKWLSESLAPHFSGTRFICAVPTNKEDYWHIQICDFGKYAHSNQKEIANPSEANLIRYVDTKEVNPSLLNRIFTTPLESHLSYLELRKKEPSLLQELMLDHENIYLMQNRRKSKNQQKRKNQLKSPKIEVFTFWGEV